MQYILEIAGRFSEPRSCNELLYAPMRDDTEYRETKVYNLEYTGNRDHLEAFATVALVDPLSQAARPGGRPYYDDFRMLIDISLKPQLLDLEREYILEYHRRGAGGGSAGSPFRLNGLSIARRFYIQGRTEDDFVRRFLRDIANPAIHEWCVTHG